MNKSSNAKVSFWARVTNYLKKSMQMFFVIKFLALKIWKVLSRNPKKKAKLKKIEYYILLQMFKLFFRNIEYRLFKMLVKSDENQKESIIFIFKSMF